MRERRWPGGVLFFETKEYLVCIVVALLIEKKYVTSTSWEVQAMRCNLSSG
jgi:hypothetical protein